MADPMKNEPDINELRRKRRSLKGKIERRYTTILLAQGEMREMRVELQMIEELIAELSKK